jgi:hypothetical protein
LDQWALGIQERPKVGVHLTLKELEELQQAVHGVDISENFLSDYSTLWELLSSNGIVISDRRRVQILKFLKAWTLVQGESQLCADHFHNSLVHMIYRNIEDQKTIREVIETQFPTAAKLLGDARRAADTIMTQFNVSSRKIEGASIESLNDYAKDLKRYHRDIQTIGSKVDELMDNPISKMPASVRMKGVKLQNILEEYKNKIAATLAELPG